MNRKPLGIAAVILLMLWGLVGCKPAATGGPPKILYGQDVCAECGMIISADRFACAISESANGDKPALLFDDIGCMVDYEKSQSVGRERARYVHDYDNREWVRAERAFFVKPGKIETPMGSGLIAFGDEAAAQAALHDGVRHPETFSELLVHGSATSNP